MTRPRHTPLAPSRPESGWRQVSIRIDGTDEGSIGDVRLDGEVGASQILVYTTEDGCRVVTATVLPTSRAEIKMPWSMTTAAGQKGRWGHGVTAGVPPGEAQFGAVAFRVLQASCVSSM